MNPRDAGWHSERIMGLLWISSVKALSWSVGRQHSDDIGLLRPQKLTHHRNLNTWFRVLSLTTCGLGANSEKVIIYVTFGFS